MDIWPKYKSPLGYLAGDSKIDTYGVDHSKFSLRDEIAYQMARADREEQLIKSFNSQGINKDYPQYGTNFWGGNAANNYGFGSSDISENIENVTNSLKNSTYAYDPNTGLIAPTPQQNQALGQQNNAAIGQNNTLQNQTPTPWNPDIAGKPQNQTPAIENSSKNICLVPENSEQSATIVQNNNQTVNNTNEVQQASAQSSSCFDDTEQFLKCFADATKTATVAWSSGETLGNFDEIMGAGTAAVTLNGDNYTMGRDAVRQYQEELHDKNPILYESAEFIGAMSALLRCPESVLTGMKVSNPALFNAISDTFVASFGYAEDWKDFLANLAANGAANTLGYKAKALKFSRGIGKLLKTFLNNKVAQQGINYAADKTKNLFYNKEEEEK